MLARQTTNIAPPIGNIETRTLQRSSFVDKDTLDQQRFYSSHEISLQGRFDQNIRISYAKALSIRETNPHLNPSFACEIIESNPERVLRLLASMSIPPTEKTANSLTYPIHQTEPLLSKSIDHLVSKTSRNHLFPLPLVFSTASTHHLTWELLSVEIHQISST